MTSLVDTNVLFFRYDFRSPSKKARAEEILRQGSIDGTLVLSHQTIVEFVWAATRGTKGGTRLMEMSDAVRIAGNLASEFEVLYPDEKVLRLAVTGVVMHPFSWFDAHMWAYAEANGIPELLSEDHQHGRRYGNVRVVNPFLPAPENSPPTPA